MASLGALVGPSLPAEVSTFLGETGAELLERELGGVIQQARFDAAPASLSRNL